MELNSNCLLLINVSSKLLKLSFPLNNLKLTLQINPFQCISSKNPFTIYFQFLNEYLSHCCELLRVKYPCTRFTPQNQHPLVSHSPPPPSYLRLRFPIDRHRNPHKRSFHTGMFPLQECLPKNGRIFNLTPESGIQFKLDPTFNNEMLKFLPLITGSSAGSPLFKFD